jgi:hypothetical protein
MPWWVWLLDSLVILVVLGLVALLALISRRRWITRDAGAFDMSVNRYAEPGAAGWTLGIAVYRDSTVDWYRTFSPSLRPGYSIPRGEVIVEGRREPTKSEAYALHHGHVVVTCEGSLPLRQLALSPNNLTALLAWLESSPPGLGVNQVL